MVALPSSRRYRVFKSGLSRCFSHWAMMVSMIPVTLSRTRDIDVVLYFSSFLSPYEKHLSVEITSSLPPSVRMLIFFTPSIPMNAGLENLSSKFVGFVSSILPLFIGKGKKNPFLKGVILLYNKGMSNDRKTRRAPRRVEVTNPDGTTTTYRSISQTAKALGKHAA